MNSTIDNEVITERPFGQFHRLNNENVYIFIVVNRFTNIDMIQEK